MSRLERPELFITKGLLTSKASVVARQFLPEPVIDVIRYAKEGGSLSIPQDEPLCLEFGNIKAQYWVKNKSDQRILHAIKGEGNYGTSIVQTVASEGGTFVDIGCAQGLYTIPAALSGAKVVAIDPDVRMITALHKNQSINPQTEGRITTFPLAVGENQDFAPLYLDMNKTYAASLNRNLKKQNTQIKVPIWPYDSLVENGHIPPEASVVKIDVEGAEGQVVRGMRETFSSDTPPKHLFVEIHTLFLPKFGEDPYDLFDQIINHGYELVEEPVARRFEVMCHFRHQ